MANPHYNNLANDINQMINEQNAVIVGGHDEIFHPPATDYECPICMTVLRNPVQTHCGHRFCAGCINGHMTTNGNTCPIDNQVVNQNEIYPDNFTKREINQLNVKCRTVKNKKECPWSGPLQAIEEHLQTCEFVEVPCSKGCNQNVERKALDQHLKKECLKRTVICQHCKTEVQHKNHKEHLGKCQKMLVPCPNCNKKVLREKLIASHDKECPKAQVSCEFKPYGCKWTGQRLHVPNHMNNEANMAAHISMMGNALSALLPSNGRDKNRAGASNSQVNAGASGSNSASGGAASSASGSIVEELNRQRNRNAESIATFEGKVEQLERKFRDLTARLERQHVEYVGSMENVKESFVELEARTCNGVYLWRIQNYPHHLVNARDNIVTALHSPPFYTGFYGYKMCLRIHPNGMNDRTGTHASLMVHVMQSEWDDNLVWPFSGQIELSILDRSDNNEKRHITETLITRPNHLALQRPTTNRNDAGFGYEAFARCDRLQSRRYVKGNCLFILANVSVG